MKKSLNLSTIILAIFLFACKKDSSASYQTITILQNKWALVSESLTYPTNPSMNSTYSGISTDYYWFNSQDTLIIHQAGDPFITNNPLNIAIRYSIPSNNLILLNAPNPSADIHLSVEKITQTELILTNGITATVTNNGGITQTVYNGTRTINFTK